MKKIILILIIVIGALLLFLLSSNDCDILPKDANYELVFGDNIFVLTPHGLICKGRIFDYDKWRGVEYRHIKDIKFNKATSMIYLNDYSVHNSALYKININNLSGSPIAIPYTNSVREYSISPDGKYLVFQNNDENLYLLDMNSKRLQKLGKIIPRRRNFNASWINSHQFIYYGRENEELYDYYLMSCDDELIKNNTMLENKINVYIKENNITGNASIYIYNSKKDSLRYAYITNGKISGEIKTITINLFEKPDVVIDKLITDMDVINKKLAFWNINTLVYKTNHINNKGEENFKIFLFDIDSMTTKDMKLNNCSLASVAPDGKKILLSEYGKYGDQVVLYDIFDKTIEIIKDKHVYVSNVIWLSDGKGFVYNARHWKDKLVSFEGCGLYYYSLEKKKHVRLASLAIELYDIGGFSVPFDIKIKLPDSKWNRDFPTHADSRLMQICTKRFNFDWFK